MANNHSNNGARYVNSLTDIGLSEREAKVYLALLKKRQATAADLQKLSGVPQNKVYETISSLIRQGFCTERKSGRRRTFEIIDPEVTLASPFERLQKRLKGSYEVRKELNDIYKLSEKIAEPLEYIEVLRGNDSIHHHYCKLVNGVNKELLGFGRGPYAFDSTEKLYEQTAEELEIVKRGGDVRWVFELNFPDDEWLLDGLMMLIENGIRIKVAERLPLKLMIFDRDLLLVAEEEQLVEPGELIMSIMRHKTIVNAFTALFEYFWNSSADIEGWMNKMNINKLTEKK